MVAHCRLICVANAATSFPEEHLWVFGENAILLGMVPRTCKLLCHFRKSERRFSSNPIHAEELNSKEVSESTRKRRKRQSFVDENEIGKVLRYDELCASLMIELEE